MDKENEVTREENHEVRPQEEVKKEEKKDERAAPRPQTTRRDRVYKTPSPTLTSTQIQLSGTPPITYVGKEFRFLPIVTGNNGSGLFFTAQNLPPGAQLDPQTGAISGRAKTSGTFTTEMTVTQSGQEATATYTFSVFDVLQISGDPDPAYVGALYSFVPRVDYTGMLSKLSFSGTNLPPGLELNEKTGHIGGTPTGPVNGESFITVTDGCSTATLPLTFNIALAIIVSGTPAPAPINSYYQFAPTIENVYLPGGKLTVSLSSGTLPVGLTFDPSTGIVSGYPTTTGDSTVVFTYSNGYSSTMARFTFTVIAPFQIMDIVQTFSEYITTSYQIQSVNGNSSYTWEVVGGTLPNGFTINNYGLLGGQATETGIFPVTIQVTNDNQKVTTKQVTVQIVPLTQAAYDKWLQQPENHNKHPATITGYIAETLLTSYCARVLLTATDATMTKFDLSKLQQPAQCAASLLDIYFLFKKSFTSAEFENGFLKMAEAFNWIGLDPTTIEEVLAYATQNTGYIDEAIVFYTNIYNAYKNLNTPINKGALIRKGCKAALGNYLAYTQNQNILASLSAAGASKS